MAGLHSGFTEITPNQNSKTVSINDALQRVESSVHGLISLDLSGGNVTVTQSEMLEHLLFDCTGLVADTDLIFPISQNGLTSNKLLWIRNDSAYNLTVKTDDATPATVILAANTSNIIMINGNALIPFN